MAETLYELLNRCTVRIVVPATQEHGTGFFVAPGQVVTCAHVVKGVPSGTLVQLFWRAQQDQSFQELCAKVRLWIEVQDIALLTLDDPPDHPCVWLAEESAPFQELYSFGYPMHLAAGGTSVRFTCEGWTERDEQTLLTLTDGQVVPGMSGAPVLSRQTGQICGILAITRDQASNLGGRAILTRTLWQVVPALREAQTAWKQQDQRWRTCLKAHQRTLALPAIIGIEASNQMRRPRDYLPLQPTPLFQDRPGEFVELEHLLFGQSQPARLGLVGVVGLGGVGKTYLAVEVATRYRDRFPDGVYWMTATGTLVDWQSQLADLAERVGYLPGNDVNDQPSIQQRAQHFATYLAEHRGALLILDNVEQPDLVSSALSALTGIPQPACTILYTSRVKSKPDDSVKLHSVEALPEDAALRLLLQETRSDVLMQALAHKQSSEAHAARTLCQSVGFLPLALVHLRRLLESDPLLTVTQLMNGAHARGALDIAKKAYKDAKPLFATFALSWERVQDPRARRLFYLAGFFPKSTPIPLWLLGLAADLGERSEPWEPLGEARLILQDQSLIEPLSDEQVRMHPLVSEFAQRLVAEWRDQGKELVQQANARLVNNLTDLTLLEARARRRGYLGCREQVRAAQAFLQMLDTEGYSDLARLGRWLDQESNMLAQKTYWPNLLPSLFFQQFHNRAVEEGQTPHYRTAPEKWIRQLTPVRKNDQSMTRKVKSHRYWVTSAAFSLDGKQVLTGSNDGTLRLWETSTRRLLHVLEGSHDGASSVACSPDGSRVFAGTTGGSILIWEVDSRRLLRTLNGHQQAVTNVAVSPDGRQALTGSLDQTARLWEVNSGQQLLTLDARQRWIGSVAFSPDGSQILTGSDNGTVMLWETSTGKVISSLMGHQGYLTSIAFSPDGSQILTGSWEQTVWLWRASSGKRLLTLDKHQDGIAKVVFSPDGQLVVTSDFSGYVYCWACTGRQAGKLQALFLADYRVQAFHWLDGKNLLLADTGGPCNKPNIYWLMLEGM